MYDIKSVDHVEEEISSASSTSPETHTVEWLNVHGVVS
jgi:hypothetical protein